MGGGENVKKSNCLMKHTKRPLTILIPNGTSPKNMGDLAMLQSLVAIIRNQVKDVHINLHSFDAKAYDEDPGVHSIKPTLYEWAVFECTGIRTRFVRIFQLVISIVALRLNLFKYIQKFISPVLVDLLADYTRADLVILAAGGYLRSKPGIKQSLNFLMQLVPFWIAKFSAKRAVVAPVSFGPFSYSWQEKFAAKSLSGYRAVFAREEISYSRMKANTLQNVIKSSDLALALAAREKHLRYTSKHPVVGYTIRTWFPKDKQKVFERQFAMALVRFSGDSGAVIQPIIQVDAVKYGDDDAKVTDRVAKILTAYGIKVLPTVRTHSLPVLLQAYGSVDLLVGMRMHANILAATQGTPYIAISYEYKTEGISRLLGMSQFCIRCEEMTDEAVYGMISRAYRGKTKIKKQLQKIISVMKKRQVLQWQRVLGA